MARTQPGPTGYRPLLCSVALASRRAAPGACPLPTPSPPYPKPRLPHLSRARRADWACSGARPRAVRAERMHSPGRGLAVQGRGAQEAALADALASLRRTRARMASLTAYGTAGGRASQAGRASQTRHPGKLRGSVMSVRLLGSEPNPGAKRCTSAAQGGCLGTGKRGLCQ